MPNSSDTEARRLETLGVVPETTPATGSDHGDADDSGGDGHERAEPWEIGLPAVVALAYLAVALAVGPDAFDTGAPGLAGWTAAVALAALLLAALRGTVRLFDDAARLRRTEIDWQPDPWKYLFGGTAGLLAVRAIQLGSGAVSPTQPIPYLAGNVVVAAVLSSLLAGPVYLLRRRRAGA